MRGIVWLVENRLASHNFFYMLYEISYVTITIALLIVYFTLLRKVINLKVAHS